MQRQCPTLTPALSTLKPAAPLSWGPPACSTQPRPPAQGLAVADEGQAPWGPDGQGEVPEWGATAPGGAEATPPTDRCEYTSPRATNPEHAAPTHPPRCSKFIKKLISSFKK